MNDHYILLLKDGNFVSYEQISDDEVEVVSTSFELTNLFPTLQEAQEAAKGINTGQDNGFRVYSNLEVQSILRICSIE